jgi:hypothetical protein
MNFWKVKSSSKIAMLVFALCGAHVLIAEAAAASQTNSTNAQVASVSRTSTQVAAAPKASLAKNPAGQTNSAHAVRKISDFPKSPIFGKWKFFKMSIDGTEMPPRDQRMELTFTFDEEGVSTLYWSYDSGATFCERKGRYLFQDGFLVDEIYWANPKNKFDCAVDPDMQVGRRSTSKVDFSDDEFVLYIPFSSKEILYYWKKVEE